VQLNPKNDQAHQQLGIALQYKGDWDGATVEWREGEVNRRT
jgi:Flp pilus assembly protein TadD